MFNPDLKKMLKNCNSRYSLVVGVAKRAREIRDEAVKNEVLLDEKSVSTAINEIYDGKYIVEEPNEIKAKK
ncbi:MAG: DNA-directed RNA polymerase subunit omega [Eubacterium sp.]|uniref:DNA-directed RNA polymerase subunit omega n=1 Tax=Eubacterium sp. TaxID=142586 RepID=UPI003A37B701